VIRTFWLAHRDANLLEGKMIGQTISHYKILEKLGEGGMSVVYKAEDTKLKRTVALKFLSPQAVGTEEDRTRFAHEAQAAAALSHPNICTVHEIDEYEDRSFIAMECIEGESLKARVKSGPLGVYEAVEIAAEIADGLQEAHTKGIIHRDIKSANVMLTAKGRVKVMDFGVAKSYGRTQLTRSGTTIGTAAYMSPEQGTGDSVDHRTDIWSLGIVLYEMLTGELPFKADYEQATIYRIINEEPPSVTSLRSDVPKELERIIEKALKKDVRERYQSAEDLKKDLETLTDTVRLTSTRSNITQKEDKPSIAVLPFRDMSSQRDQEYFCEGIAEELINVLVKLEGLRVAARTSAFQFKDRGSSIKTIGEQLEVKTVLEGSIRKSGNRLRITAQLINVEDGFHIWSDKYDRDLDDIFAIQDEISLAIVDKLRVKLLGKERSALVKRHTVNQEAHNLYLKGLYFWNRRLEGGMKIAMEHFLQAIDKDPGYALAHAGVADTYNISGLFGFAPPKEIFAKAKAAANRTLEIDDSLGEAHASRAFSTAFFDWDWPTAEDEFKRAIELNPSYATAHEWHAIFLFAMGRFDESIKAAERARELDPLSLMINSVVGITYYFARRYEESIEHHKKALEMDPNFLLATTYSTLAYVECGMFDEVIDLIRKAEPLATENTYSLGYFGGTYGRAGQKDDALRILARLDELARERYVSPLHRANVLVGIGEIDEALNEMEKAYTKRCPVHSFSNTMPYFDCLKSNQRFKELMKKIGF
jgi:serine/threonine protein kinase/tetratricopeptide (TPR) repeat protein